MIEKIEFFKESGMKWENYVGKETLWQKYNTEENFEEMVEPSRIDKLIQLFDTHGYLLIEDKKKFTEMFDCQEALREIPAELIGCFDIQMDKVVEYETQITVYLNWDEIEIFVESDKHVLLKEKFCPGYTLKKLFNEKEASARLTEIIGNQLHVFWEVLEEILNRNLDEIINDLIGHCLQLN